MPDFNKGDFTQQGVNGHVNATVRLNEKRLVKIDLTSNEEDEGCTISGSITDLLNNIVYPLETPPGLFDYLGKDTVLLDEKDFTYNLAEDTTYSSWTPTTTSTVINSDTVTLINRMPLEQGYVYLFQVTQYLEATYDQDVVNNSLLTNTNANYYFVRPVYSNYAGYDTETYTQWNSSNYGITNRQIYRNSAGQLTLTASASGGPMSTSFTGAVSGSFSSGLYSITRSSIKAQCVSSSFSTDAATHIVPADTDLHVNIKIFKTPLENSNLRFIYDDAIDFLVPVTN